MTGIDIIKKAIENNYTGKFIIMSGHSEFNYAQAAISLNVIDYLLKPVLPDKLFETLEQTITIIEHERQLAETNSSIRKQLADNIPLIREKFIEGLFSNKTFTQEEFLKKTNFLELPFSDVCFKCMAIKINHKLYKSLTSEYLKQTIELEILSNISELFGLKDTYVGFKNDICYYLLYFAPDKANEFSDLALRSVLSQMKEVIEKKYTISISFYFGNTVDSYKDIRASYKQSKECIKKAFLRNYNNFIFYSEIEDFDISSNYLEPFNKTKLSRLISNFDFANSREYVIGVLDIFSNPSNKNIQYACTISHEILCTILEAIYGIDEYNPEMLDSTDMLNVVLNSTTYDELYDFFNKLFDILNSSFRNAKFSEKTIESTIKSYIDEHYSENITLKTLSKITYCSPAYISNFFTNKIGIPYKTYLTNIRMKKAFELLQTGNYKVYEVSEMVGYKKTDYFRLLFQQYFHINPKKIEK